MSSHQPDEGASTKLPTESPGWNGLQALKSRLTGRLAGFVPHRRPGDRPGKLENDAAFFEDDLYFIIQAKPLIVHLPEKIYKEMDNTALRLLDSLNDMVNGKLIESQELLYSCESKSHEHFSPQSYDIVSLANKHSRLSDLFCFLQARPDNETRFNLLTGSGPSLFAFPNNGYGKLALGRAKKWRAFLDSLTADAMMSVGSQLISLEAMGLSAEELADDLPGVLDRHASMVVGSMFKEFRKLNCANAKIHEIKLRLSRLYTGPPQPVLDIFLSCCPNKTSGTWHEAECGSSPLAIDMAGEQSLCTVIDQAIESSRKLYLLVNPQGLFDVTDRKPPMYSSWANFTSKALKDLFCQKLFSGITVTDYRAGEIEKKFGSKEKANIALVLARCLLDLFDNDIELASHTWAPEQILFISPSTTDTTRGDLYISLRPNLYEVKSADLLEEFTAGNPILLSFARLLLEINTGETIAMEIHPDKKDNIKNWVFLCGFVEEKLKIGEDAQYMEAVEGCLHLCKDLPRSKDRATGSAARKVLSKAIYAKIVRKLDLIVNPQNSKRKRRCSVSEYRQGKKTSTASPSGENSPVAAFAPSGSRAAMTVSRGSRLAKLSDGRTQPVDFLNMSVYDEQNEKSTTPEKSTYQVDGGSDGHLCKSLETSTDLADPRTFEVLKKTWNSRFEFKEGDVLVKIAILDTGIDLLHDDFQNMRALSFNKGQPESAIGETTQIKRMPIECRKNFCGGDESNVQDLDGHGTQVASIILRLAPRAELCIARICHGDVNRGLTGSEMQVVAEESYIQNPRSEIVVNAIKWAIEQTVDIINLSFGFARPDREVNDALRLARDRGILIFSAMANHGIYKKAAWPARESNAVIGIHSCVDMGKTSSEFTPRLVQRNSNFMVIGERIIAHWPAAKGGGFRAVEGTSFATPVAAAIAALILAFANQTRCQKLREESQRKVEVKELWRNSGMTRVLEKISEKSADGYSWIDPMLLWATFPEDDEEDTPKTVREHGWKVICRALRE